MLKTWILNLVGIDLTQATNEARALIRARLQSRSPHELSQTILEAGVEEADWNAAQDLLRALGTAFSVDPGVFRATDTMGDLVRVKWSELSDQSREALRRSRAIDPLEEFNYDIFFELEQRADRTAWDLQRRKLVPPPTNEEEWLDAIVRMTLPQFLKFFAPAIK